MLSYRFAWLRIMCLNYFYIFVNLNDDSSASPAVNLTICHSFTPGMLRHSHINWPRPVFMLLSFWQDKNSAPSSFSSSTPLSSFCMLPIKKREREITLLWSDNLLLSNVNDGRRVDWGLGWRVCIREEKWSQTSFVGRKVHLSVLCCPPLDWTVFVCLLTFTSMLMSIVHICDSPVHSSLQASYSCSCCKTFGLLGFC